MKTLPRGDAARGALSCCSARIDLPQQPPKPPSSLCNKALAPTAEETSGSGLPLTSNQLAGNGKTPRGPRETGLQVANELIFKKWSLATS